MEIDYSNLAENPQMEMQMALPYMMAGDEETAKHYMFRFFASFARTMDDEDLSELQAITLREAKNRVH